MSKHNIRFSSQLIPAQMAEAAKAGFKGILCNLPDSEAGGGASASMRAECAKHGLQFAYIPVSGPARPEQIHELRRFVEQCKGPIIAYCRSGARSQMICSQALA